MVTFYTFLLYVFLDKVFADSILLLLSFNSHTSFISGSSTTFTQFLPRKYFSCIIFLSWPFLLCLRSPFHKKYFKSPSLGFHMQNGGCRTLAGYVQIWRAGSEERKHSLDPLWCQAEQCKCEDTAWQDLCRSVMGGLIFITIHCETGFPFTHNWILHKLYAIFPLNLLAVNICRPHWGHLIATLKLPNHFHIRNAWREENLRRKVMNPSTNSTNRHWASCRFLSVLGT